VTLTLVLSESVTVTESDGDVPTSVAPLDGEGDDNEGGDKGADSVVNDQVALEAVSVPSLETTYHEYVVEYDSPDQVYDT
jgi:hypothetical protein